MNELRRPRHGGAGLIVLGVVAVIVIVILVVVLWFFSVRNRLVRLDEASNSAWAQVQNVYQRRLDLVPNLVATVRGAAAHELDVQVGVVRERAAATQMRIDPKDPAQFQQFAQQQAQLGGALGRLLVTVENYPQIRANENFLSLQSQLEGTENRISVERGRFNEAVREYNAAIRMFPGFIVAGFAGFKERPYFTGETEAQVAPKVDFASPRIDTGTPRPGVTPSGTTPAATPAAAPAATPGPTAVMTPEPPAAPIPQSAPAIPAVTETPVVTPPTTPRTSSQAVPSSATL